MNHHHLASLVAQATRDTIIVGDGLMLRRRGGQWSWSVRYRSDGVRRRVSLGRYPRVTLSAARTAASKVLRQVDLGEDPQALQRAARAAAERAKRDSIAALSEAFIEWAKSHKRTWRDDQQRLNSEILPKWRTRPATSITRRDVRELLQAIADRPAPVYADRVGAVLSKMFSFALQQEIIPVNPAWRFPRHTPKPDIDASPAPAKAYDDDEVRRIWKNTKTLPASVAAPIRLGLITGQRPGECRDLEWSELDGHWWTIPARRSKNGREHRVYLTQMALDEIAKVPRKGDEPKVFAGVRGKRQLSEWNRQAFKGVRRRLKPRHALRDVVLTGLARCGVDESDIAKVANHAYGPAVTRVYNAYRYDREKRLALMKWTRRLQQILDATDEQKVVPIAR